MIKLSMLDRGD